MTSQPRQGEAGFTLIELLVVLVIIAILSAIAIPVFYEQREKAYVAQMQSALKNAAIAAETYAVNNNGSYAGLNNLDGSHPILAGLGFVQPEWAIPTSPSDTTRYLQFRQVTDTYYCIQARHGQLSISSDWRRSTYQSSVGKPQPVPDTC
jgi:prepilin-type N-terminal cleavage/methylation domain-containing protein